MRRFNFNNIDIKEVPGFVRRHTREPARQAGPPAHVDGSLKPAPGGRVKIGFVGLSAGAGATTLAFAATEYLAALVKKRQLVTMLELDPAACAPAGRPYDKVGIDRRFAGREFVSLHRLAAEGKPLQGALNIDGGVGWALRIPGEPGHGAGAGPGPGLSAATLLRLLNNAAGDIIVCDIPARGFFCGGSAGRDAFLALLADLDRVICVFDPLPSRLLASVPAAEACRAAEAAGVKTTWVFNKLNNGVNLREATRFTGVRDFIPFPAVPADAVYAAEYACRSLAAEPEIKISFDKIFQ